MATSKKKQLEDKASLILGTHKLVFDEDIEFLQELCDPEVSPLPNIKPKMASAWLKSYQDMREAIEQAARLGTLTPQQQSNIREGAEVHMGLLDSDRYLRSMDKNAGDSPDNIEPQDERISAGSDLAIDLRQMFKIVGMDLDQDGGGQTR